jgi:LAGLIDADG endonuclease
LHSKDLDSLYLIQRFFGVGNVTLHGNSAMFQVVKLSNLVYIIEHFNNYPLKTQKYADFLLFKLAFNLIKDKEHLTEIGIRKLISIRASLNKGLTKKLKAAFPNAIPIKRFKNTKAALEKNSLGVKH